MAHIHDLPTELLARIISHVLAKRTLASLCLVSRLFRKLSEPFLYNAYANGKKVPDDERTQSETGLQPFSPASLRKFARTVVTSPRLAKKVKGLHLGRWPVPCSPEGIRQLDGWDPIQQQDMAQFLAAGRDLPLNDDDYRNSELSSDNWAHLVSLGSSDAIVRLLLAYLPELEELRMVFGEERAPTWTFIARMVTTPEAFPYGALRKLRRLEAVAEQHHEMREEGGTGRGGRFSDDGYQMANGNRMSPGRISFFLALPHLRSVRGVAWDGDLLGKRSTWEFPAGAIMITDIDLIRCTLDYSRIGTLMMSLRPQKLRSFRYHGMNGGKQFAPALLMAFLRAQHTTLEVLELCLISENWREENRTVRDLLLGSLIDFGRLKVLVTNEWCMLPYDIWTGTKLEHGRRLVDLIPRSLELLELRQCMESEPEQYFDLATACQRTRMDIYLSPKFLKLKTVVLRMDLACTGENWSKVADAFAKAGVRFSI